MVEMKWKHTSLTLLTQVSKILICALAVSSNLSMASSALDQFISTLCSTLEVLINNYLKRMLTGKLPDVKNALNKLKEQLNSLFRM